MLRLISFLLPKLYIFSLDGQTLSRLDGALKKNYTQKIIDALYNMSPFYKLLKKETTAVKNTGSGLKAVVPIRTTDNMSPMAIDEGGALPVARYSQHVQMEIPLAYNYGLMEFSGQTLAASESDKTSFGNVVDIETASLTKSIKLSVDRQLTNGDGTGLLCMTNGAGGGADATVTCDTPGTQWLYRGMPIVTTEAVTGDDPSADEDISEGLAESTAYTVYEITDDTHFELGNAACSAAVTTEKWHDNHYMFRYGSVNGGGTTFTATNKEAMGLKGIVDDYSLIATSSWFGSAAGTLTMQNLSRSTYPILNATISHNSNINRAISEDVIIQHLDKIEQVCGQDGDNPNRIFISSYGLRRKYFGLLSPDRRYQNPITLEGGWKTLTFNYGNVSIPWIVSKMAIPNTLFTLDLRYLAIYQNKEFQWMDFNGNMFEKKSGYDAYYAVMYNYSGLGCTNFKAQGAIRDLTEA